MSPSHPEPRDEVPATPSPPAGQSAADAERIEAFRQWTAVLRQLTPRAPVTPVLVVLNVVVYAVMAASVPQPLAPAPLSLLGWGANYGPATAGGEWWRLVSCAFLHGGLVHLGFNMLCLWGVGRATERLIGSPGFLLMYLTSAVAGSLASVAWNPMIVSVGASGAVFGTFGAFFAVTLRAADTIPKPALSTLRVTTAKLLGLNFVAGFFVPNIDVAAHAGGLAWGFAAGLVLGHPLTVDAAGRRPRRNLRLAAAFVPVVALGTLAAWSRVSAANEALAELERIEVEADRVLGVYNDAIQRSQDGTLGDAAAHTIMEDGVLKPWNRLRERFSRIQSGSGLNPQVMELYGDYLRLRGESFGELHRAAGANDHAAAARSRQKMEEAGRAMRKLRGGG